MTAIPDGTPLVLLNAFPVDREQWEPLIAALSPSLPGDVIAFDIPGIGQMPMTDEEPSLELIADAAVLAMREATGHDAAVWVGCSMGGYIALAVAEREPTAVAGLGLLCTRATADDAGGIAKRRAAADAALEAGGVPDPAGAAAGLIGTEGPDRDDLVTLVAANIARHGGEGVAWGQRAMAARPDRTEVLRNVDAPVVVVIGGNDQIVPRADAEAMASAAGVDPVVLDGVGHLCALEAPQAVARALAPLVN
jgi:pimeloyl-ACP methyl ester carboxylesterase